MQLTILVCLDLKNFSWSTEGRNKAQSRAYNHATCLKFTHTFQRISFTVISVHRTFYDNVAKALYNTTTSIANSTTTMTQDEDQAYPVRVYVYDLSHGLAAQYSPMLLGFKIDAVYHTSVVAYGRETYIQQGIKSSLPGKTKYGLPLQVLDLGETYITQDIFEEFLEELRAREDLKYHETKYDLFENNCNHFTDVLTDFLVGKNLDEKILNLPEAVLNSPNGQMFKQMMGNGGGFV